MLSVPLTALGHDREKFRDQMFAIIERRVCYYAGWVWANQQEGFESGVSPACLWPTHLTSDSSNPILCPSVQNETPMFDTGSGFNSEWDAGDMACGDLVLELRMRLRSIKPGEILKVVATDDGAPQDLPAWCRMTGNTLVQYCHPAYFIKRKAD